LDALDFLGYACVPTQTQPSMLPDASRRLRESRAMDVTRARSLLGVGHLASVEEIESAYRRASLDCHPDKNPDDREAVQRFLDLSTARESAVAQAATRTAATRTCTVLFEEINKDIMGGTEEETFVRRPRGRAPAGKVWDHRRGEWINEPSAGPGGILADDVPVPLGSNPAEEELVAPAVDPITPEATSPRQQPVGQQPAEGPKEKKQRTENAEPYHIPGSGGCVAVALQKLLKFTSQKQAALALDEMREEHRKAVRPDQDNEAFLGIPSQTWHIEIVKKVVVEEGYDFRDQKKKAKAILKAQKAGETATYLVDGVVNDHYTRPFDSKIIKPYCEDATDYGTPRTHPHHWAHTVAVKTEGYKAYVFQDRWMPLSVLWLDEDGRPDKEKGLMYEIRKVYRVSEHE